MKKLVYFKDCKTAEELKKEYFRLAMLHHPDRGGDTEIMKKINAEYDKVFEILKNIHTDANGNEYTAKKETTETAEMFKDILSKIIHFVGVKIEICGSWVWVSGNTRTYKNELKEAGFKWSGKKFMWYWRAEEYRAWNNRKSHDMEYIRRKWGSEEVEVEPLTAIV